MGPDTVDRTDRWGGEEDGRSRSARATSDSLTDAQMNAVTQSTWVRGRAVGSLQVGLSCESSSQVMPHQMWLRSPGPLDVDPVDAQDTAPTTNRDVILSMKQHGKAEERIRRTQCSCCVV